MPEAELYGPIKAFLQGQGYEVKGEIGACDVVAVRGNEGPVVVELKEQLNLALLLQAADRLAVSDTRSRYVSANSLRGGATISTDAPPSTTVCNTSSMKAALSSEYGLTFSVHCSTKLGHDCLDRVSNLHRHVCSSFSITNSGRCIRIALKTRRLQNARAR